MKHTFCIHSPITYLMMRSIIDHHNLNKDDVIVFTSRNYKFKWDKVKTYELRTPQYIRRSKKDFKIQLLNFLLPFKIISWYIKICIHLKFRKSKLYIPHSGNNDWSMLSAHTLIKSINYIEEGAVYYVKKNTEKYFQKKKVSRSEIILTLGLKKYSNCFLPNIQNTYIFSNLVNKNFKNTTLLPLKNAINYIRNHDDIQEVIILIDGGSVWNMKYTLNQHLSIMEDVIDYIKTHYSNHKISYKLHPNQINFPDQKQAFEKLFSDKIPHAQELNQSTIIESYLCNRNKVIFCGYSSFSIYSYILNYPIKSFVFDFGKYNQELSKANLEATFGSKYVNYLALNTYNQE